MTYPEPSPAPSPAPGQEGGFQWTVGKVGRRWLWGKLRPSLAPGRESCSTLYSLAAFGAAQRERPRSATFPLARRCLHACAKPRSKAAPRPAPQVFLSLFLFLAAGVAEIGGGWLVWQALREHKGWWLAVLGAGVLFLYGVLPTFQPLDNFGRVGYHWGVVYACTGGVGGRVGWRGGG